jgi:hypothetical protein
MLLVEYYFVVVNNGIYSGPWEGNKRRVVFMETVPFLTLPRHTQTYISLFLLDPLRSSLPVRCTGTLILTVPSSMDHNLGSEKLLHCLPI